MVKHTHIYILRTCERECPCTLLHQAERSDPRVLLLICMHTVRVSVCLCLCLCTLILVLSFNLSSSFLFCFFCSFGCSFTPWTHVSLVPQYACVFLCMHVRVHVNVSLDGCVCVQLYNQNMLGSFLNAISTHVNKATDVHLKSFSFAFGMKMNEKKNTLRVSLIFYQYMAKCMAVYSMHAITGRERQG